jgi:membrane protein
MIPDKLLPLRVRRIADMTRRKTDAVLARVRRIFVIELLVRTAKESSEDDVTHMAAGVAYYGLFSLFPLLLGLIAILSFFLESGEIQAKLTTLTAGYLPGSEQLVSDNIDAVVRLRGALSLVSVLGLLWSGSAIFGAINRAINRAWDIHSDRPLYKGKPRQMFLAAVVGVLFAISISSATVVRTASDLAQYKVPVLTFLVQTVGRVMLQGLSFVLVFAIFLIIYKFMPNTRTYWRYIWPGALLGTVLFELAKNLFILYLERSSFQNVYGTVTPVIVLLLWTYVSSLILLVGAEISSEYGRLKQNIARGTLLHPRGELKDAGPPGQAG